VNRRAWLARAMAAALAGRAATVGGAVAWPAVADPLSLAFPRDHGSHPEYRTEWWYVTGWTRDDAGVERGVQVTFFRSRPGVAETSTSAFAPRELLFAHAAIADRSRGRLVHDQRAARAGFGLAQASTLTTDVRVDDWTFALDGERYRTLVDAREFTLDLGFAITQPMLLHGERGRSRKGPRPGEASAYYSRPHLAIDGAIAIEGRRRPVRGRAWLDHEWSSEYLARDAAGWDWIGIPLDDGGALMAFRIRDRDGRALWAGATWRDAAGATRTFGPREVDFLPGRRWRSPRTGIAYPVEFEIAVGDRRLVLAPMMDDQELDARASVGIVYWEGAVVASQGRRTLGRGYLELTGYGAPLKL
jgi:predicted secreted hydrolase